MREFENHMHPLTETAKQSFFLAFANASSKPSLCVSPWRAGLRTTLAQHRQNLIAV